MIIITKFNYKQKLLLRRFVAWNLTKDEYLRWLEFEEEIKEKEFIEKNKN
jgi:hypothetical protein